MSLAKAGTESSGAQGSPDQVAYGLSSAASVSCSRCRWGADRGRRRVVQSTRNRLVSFRGVPDVDARQTVAAAAVTSVQLWRRPASGSASGVGRSVTMMFMVHLRPLLPRFGDGIGRQLAMASLIRPTRWRAARMASSVSRAALGTSTRANSSRVFRAVWRASTHDSATIHPRRTASRALDGSGRRT